MPINLKDRSFTLNLSKNVQFTINSDGKVVVNDKLGGGNASYDPGSKTFKGTLPSGTETINNSDGSIALKIGIFSVVVNFSTETGKVSELIISTPTKAGFTAKIDANFAWNDGGVVVSGKATIETPPLIHPLFGNYEHPFKADLSTVQNFANFFGFTTASFVPNQMKALIENIALQTGDAIPSAPTNTSAAVPFQFFTTKPTGYTESSVADWSQLGGQVNRPIPPDPNTTLPPSPADGYTIITYPGKGAIVAGDSGVGLDAAGSVSVAIGAHSGTTVVLGGHGQNIITGNVATNLNFLYGEYSIDGEPEIDTIIPNGATGTISIANGTASPIPLQGPGIKVQGVLYQNGDGKLEYDWTSDDGKNTQYIFTPESGSADIGRLQILSGILGKDGEIDINGFDLTKASTSSGFFGIRFSGAVYLVPGTFLPSGTGQSSSFNINTPGNVQLETVYVPVTENTAQTITLNAVSGSSLFVNTGSGMLPLSGAVTLTIPAGQNSVSFGLVDTSTSQQQQTAQLTATLNSDQAVSNSLSVTFNGAAAPFNPTTVITGTTTAGTTNFYGDNNNDIVNATATPLNVIDVGSGSDSITAGSGNDFIAASGTYGTTSDGNTTIIGGGGNDTIKAGNGNNQIYAGAQVTLATALGQLGSATATGSQGDFLSSGNGNSTIVGSNSNDFVEVGGGNNVIVLGAGNNTFASGVESDFPTHGWTVSQVPVGSVGNSSDIIPGLQLNVINVFFASPGFTAPSTYYGPIVSGQTTTSGGSIVNSAVGIGNDTIYGGTGNSYYQLSNGNNYLDAGGGNDFIFAGVGQNTLFGGAGNDTIDGGGGTNYIKTEAGSDYIEQHGGTATIVGGTGSDTVYSGSDDAHWATAIAGNNSIEGGSGNDIFYGSAGNDTLQAGVGNDTLNAGSGNQVLLGGDGNVTMQGGAGNDTLTGGDGNAVMTAGAGDTTITGGSGNTTIFGGSGNDVIDTGDGGIDGTPVLVTAGSGDTTITGGGGVDNITGGAGIDVIHIGDGGDSVQASQVTAGSGTTTITGGAGYDQVTTGAGDDTVIAGTGNMTVIGGAGTATYQIESDSGTVVINDSVQGDTLSFDDGLTIAGLSVSASGSGNGRVVSFVTSSGAVVTVNGGGMNSATFSDGTTVTFAELLSSSFTIGNTTYSAVNGVLNPVTTSLAQSAAGNGAAIDLAGGNANNVRGNMSNGGQDSAMPMATATPNTSQSSATPPQQNLTLYGNADLIGQGNNVNNVITANAGNDTLIAGSANNTLVGGGASDDYIVSAGAGTTTVINQSTGADTLRFGTGIALANLSVSSATDPNGNLDVTLQVAQGGTIVIDGSLNSSASGGDGSSTLLDTLAFADGSSASLAQLVAQLTTGPTAATSAVNDTLAGGIQNLMLTAANTSATGNAQDDVLSAGAAHDTLVAGSASDTLSGGKGSTTYAAPGGSGNVTIVNSTASDTLVFGNGISESNLITTATTVNGQSVVTLSSVQGGTVIIEGGGLNQFGFADGSTATLAQLLSPSYAGGSTIYSQVSATAGSGITTLALTGNADISATANSANDTLIANVGNDTLYAGTGNDILLGGGASDDYVVAAGMQTTTINQSTLFDTLTFGTGVGLSNLSATETTSGTGSTATTQITLTSSAGGTVVVNVGAGAPVDQIQFADGSTGSLGAILAQAITGATAATSAVSVTLPEGIQNMALIGSAAITATGNELADVIAANSGNDTLTAGVANDTLVGGSGSDTFDVNQGGGNVVITNGTAKDNLAFGAGLTESDLGTSSASVNGQTVVTISDYLDGSAITLQGGTLGNVNFADGSSATLAQLLSPSYTVGSTTYSTVNATAGTGITTLAMTGDANVIATGNGANDTLIANAGNDTLIAAGANNILVGGGASTTYDIQTAYNQPTVIEQSSSNDTVLLGVGNGLSVNAQTSRASDGSTNVTLTFSGSGAPGSVTITDYQSSSADQLVTAQGTTYSIGALVAQDNVGPTAATASNNVVLPEGIQYMTLTGTANVMATGNDQDDVILANFGNDTLVAGTANDTLFGGSGATSYEIEPGAGHAVIENSTANDTLLFGTGIDEADIAVASATVSGQRVVTLTSDQGGSAVIEGGALNNVKFGNGDTVTLLQLLSSFTEGTTLYSDINTSLPAADNGAVLLGSAISVAGNATADAMAANGSNDTLIAGSGNDTLFGGMGANTTYEVGLTSGQATIASSVSGDVLQLGSGVTLASLSFTTASDGSGNATITGANGGGIVVQESEFGMLDALAFADGSSASLGALLAQLATGGAAISSAASIAMPAGARHLTLTGGASITATGNAFDDVITANSGNDSIVAGTANDTLVAGAGNDTLVGNGGTGGATVYEFNQQSGDATTRTLTVADSGTGDTLVFGAGITASQITATSSTVNGSVVISLAVGQLGSVVIEGGGLNTLRFANGSTLSLNDLASINGTSGNTEFSSTNATLSGGLTNLVLSGSANITGTGSSGNDSILANSGNDTLKAGSGNDTLVAGAGNDALFGNYTTAAYGNVPPATSTTTFDIPGGSGNVTIRGEGWNDILAFGAGITETDLSITANSIGSTTGTPSVVIADSLGGTITVYGQAMQDNNAGYPDGYYVGANPAFVSFANGDKISFANFTSGNYTIGSRQYLSPSSGGAMTLAGGVSTLYLLGNVGQNVYANTLNDDIVGNSGTDYLYAGSGSDTLQGGSGNDNFYTGTGAVTMAGGSAINTYNIAANAGAVTITHSGTADAIDFGAGINANDLSATETQNAMGIAVVTLTDSVGSTMQILQNNGALLDQLNFSYGNSVSLASILAQSGTGLSAQTSSANVTLPGGIENMTLTGNANLTATGNSLPNVIHANNASDTLIAGSSNDTLVAGTGNDTMTGEGTVSDTTVYAFNPQGSDTSARTLTITSAGASDVLQFGAGITPSMVTASSSIVNGTAVLTLSAGQYGNVIVQGGSLNQFAFSNGAVLNANDLQPTTGLVGSTYYSSTSASMPAGANALILTGLDNLTGTGTASGQTIIGNGGNDTLTGDTLIAGGGAGNDLLIAVANQGDYLYGGNGNDTLEAPSGTTPNLYSGNPFGLGRNTTTFLVDTEQAVILAGPNDILEFGPDIPQSGLSFYHADTNTWRISFGGSNPDSVTINGSLGYIELAGNTLVPFSAFVTGSFTAGTIEYATANTMLAGGLTSLTLDVNTSLIGTGNSGNDTLSANSDSDTLVAGSGNDVLNANANGDVLEAGSGIDTLVAGVYPVTMVGDNPGGTGTGAATYILNAATRGLTINNAGSKDTLQLGAGVSANDLAVQQSGTQYDLSFYEGSTSPVVINGQIGTIKLADGTAVPLATYLANGYFVDANTEYADGNATLLSGMATMHLAGTGYTVTGNALDDTIVTDYSGDTLVAGSGNDLLQSSGANTLLEAGSGNDTLNSGNTNNTLVGGSGPTTFELYALSSYSNGTTTTIEQANSNDLLIFDSVPFVSLPSSNGVGSYYTDAQLFTYALQNGYANARAAIQSNGYPSVTIGGLTILGGASGLPAQITFGDGSTMSVEAALLDTAANTTYASSNTAMSATTVELILTGSTNLTATGNALDNVIKANSGNDSLTAGSGNDALVAGAGNDTLVAGSGNDTFQAGSATTTIMNASVADTLAGFAGTAAQITASAVTANGVTVTTLTSTSGAKVIVNGGNLNVALAGGNETLTQLLNATMPPTVTSSSSATLPGGATALTMTGSASVTATGNGLNDVITANTGNDTLYSGGGIATTLVGGSGNDTFVLANSGDVISEAANTGHNTEDVDFSATLAANVQNLTATGLPPLLVTTTLWNNAPSVNGVVTDGTIMNGLTLTGNNLNNIITAMTGQDTLIAGSGLATLIGGSGDDTFVVDNSADVVQASATLFDAAGVPVLNGKANNIEQSSVSIVEAANVQQLVGTGTASMTLTGNGTGSFIISNGHNDTLVSGGGSDQLIGASGLVLQGTLVVAPGNYASGAWASDTMVGSSKGTTSYTVNAGAGFDGGDYLAVISNSQSSDALLIANSAYQVQQNEPTAIAGYRVTSNGVTNTVLYTGGAGEIDIVGGALSTVYAGGTTTTLAQLLAQNAAVYSSANATLPGSSGSSLGNLVLTGSADLTGAATSGNNVITGNSGNDTLIGGSGNDTLAGGTGNTTFVVNSTGDTIIEAPNHGSNMEDASVSVYLAPNVQNLTGTGSAAINLTGNGLANVITANSGNDVLKGGGGAATLVGGSGNDAMIGQTNAISTYQVNAGDGTVTISSSGANDILSFGSGISAGSVTGFATGSGAATVVTLTIAGGQTVLLDAPALTQVSFTGGSTVTLASLMSTSISSSTSIVMPASATKLTLTGTGSISGTGNSLADTIIANSGNDSLIAGSGLATLVGGSGNDTFEVNNTADVIQQATANAADVVQSTANYTLPANLSILTGTGSNSITLTGNSLAGKITANSGNDTLVAGSGVATLTGGAGNDTFVVDNSSDSISVGTAKTGNVVQSAVTYVLPTNLLNLTGIGSNAISLTGNASADIITANSGNDTLTAGSGLATLIGGAGNDIFVVNNAGDIITKAANSGNNTEQTSVSITLAANIQNLTGISTGSISLTGNSLANTITANSGNDTLTAGSGIATLVGGTGNDTFVVNNGSDVITVSTAKAGNVTQSSVSYILPANLLNLTGTGSSAINLTGNTLADTITANSGNDTLTSGSGIDTLVAGAGNDTFIINNSSDVITASTAKAGNVTQTNVSYVLPANLLNLTALGSASIALTGNASADTITANSGNDTLTAGSGLATLVGGAGNDTFVINSASDVITVSAAKAGNVVQSSVSYTLGANLMSLAGGGTGAINLTGNTLADTITANSGNDTLTAGSGIATLVGGAGNDTFVVNNSSDAITVSTAKAGNVVQSNVNYVLPANLLTLTGTGSAAINLTGNALADTITANSGNDTLTSGTGIDTLVGGTGNDTFIINNSSDAITVSSAKAGNVVQSSVNYVLPTNLLSLAGTGTASISLTGNASANSITANSGNDTLTAGSGLATLIGGAGNDTFVVNSASDVITEAVNSGNNTESASVAVTLAANVQNLVATGTTAIKLTGNSGNDVITGNSGNDTLAAGAGNDTLIAGTGSTKTTMTGGAGNDTFVINNSSDTITATAGSNINTVQTSVSFTAPTNVQDLFGTGSGAIALTGNTVNNLLIGNSGNDTLTAGSGVTVIEAGSGTDVLKDTASANVLIGGSGNDSLTGGTGTSFIVGGAGNDAITLGAGAAVVAFNTGAGKATIAPGTGVSNVLSLGGGIAYANLAFSKSGNNLILNTGGNNAITFTNWYAASADKNFVTLQVIEQSAATYSSTSSNTLYSSEVEEFNFTQLVAAFNAALTANPSLTSWSLSNALLTDHLSSSNTAALGGDLAYYDGLNGNLTGMNLATAVTTLQSSTFGKTAQTIDAWSGISNGTNKLH